MLITGKKFSKPAMSRVINGDTTLVSTPDAPVKTRLDHYLVQHYPDYNRSTIQTFIKSGFVTVDNRITKKPNTLLVPDSIVTLHLPKPHSAAPVLTPLYQDANVVVYNKPTGLLSMKKGQYTPEPTLEDYGLLVHRLDRDTSGVVILAKNEPTQKLLRKQFQSRKAHKTYYAIVIGRPKLSAAKIDLPLARNLKHPTTFQVDPSGKPAQTYYRVVQQTEHYSLLELKPITGRTHQLRIHLAYIGCPIVGDIVYGPSTRLITQPRLNRMYLHAYQLEITIPTSQRRTFTAALPPEFTSLLGQPISLSSNPSTEPTI